MWQACSSMLTTGYPRPYPLHGWFNVLNGSGGMGAGRDVPIALSIPTAACRTCPFTHTKGQHQARPGGTRYDILVAACCTGAYLQALGPLAAGDPRDPTDDPRERRDLQGPV
jgi:hypothetical protein